MMICKRDLPEALGSVELTVSWKSGGKEGRLGLSPISAKPRFDLARNSAHSGCESLSSQRFLQQARFIPSTCYDPGR
jgi:hypothetical protein